MQFLEKELADLPDVYRQLVLNQLEKLIRQAKSTTLPYSTPQGLQCALICGKIGTVIDSIVEFKKIINRGPEEADES